MIPNSFAKSLSPLIALCSFTHAANVLAQTEPTSEAAPEAAPTPEAAQPSVAASADATVAAPAKAPEVVLEETPEASPTPAPPAEKPATSPEQVPGSEGQSLWRGYLGDDNYFGFDGALVMDGGYADYRFSTTTFAPESFYDFRGFFVLAPTFEHRFGEKKDLFIGGRAEAVMWLRETPGLYQINVFDAFAQLGVKRLADLQVGRVTTWRVYQRGSGFDIFTLEDTGAMIEGPIQSDGSAQFRANMYEVDNMFLRETPGRAVINAYPLKRLMGGGDYSNLGIQLAGEYGKTGLSNTIGFRGALIYDTPYVMLSGAFETRDRKLAQVRQSVQPDDSVAVCGECGHSYDTGYGGGVLLRPPFVTGGINFAKVNSVNMGANGAGEPAGRNDRQTMGMFVEVHTGDLLDGRPESKDYAWSPDIGLGAAESERLPMENQRRITLGLGLNQTEVVVGNGDYEIHKQGAAYLKYNLGFNGAFLKFVISKSAGSSRQDTGDGVTFLQQDSDMLAGRLRFGYFF